MNRQQDYISFARIHAKAIWDALNELQAMQKEWNALNYGSTLADGVDGNEGYTAVNVGAVIFDTADALRAVLDQGHATNLANLL